PCNGGPAGAVVAAESAPGGGGMAPPGPAAGPAEDWACALGLGSLMAAGHHCTSWMACVSILQCGRARQRCCATCVWPRAQRQFHLFDAAFGPGGDTPGGAVA